jgi:hypothetical protein
VLSEQIETFRQSSRTFTASEIVDTYEDIKLRLLNAWIASPSSDGEGREEKDGKSSTGNCEAWNPFSINLSPVGVNNERSSD